MIDRYFKPFPILRTERLTLRQLVSSDDNEVFALRSNDQVNKYLGRKPAESIDDASVFIETVNKNIQSNKSVYWAITLTATDKLIGTICLFDISIDDSTAGIGFELLPDFQGKGIMQEAISAAIDFALHRIELSSIKACSHVGNQRSRRLLEQFNFKDGKSLENNLVQFTLTSRS